MFQLHEINKFMLRLFFNMNIRFKSRIIIIFIDNIIDNICEKFYKQIDKKNNKKNFY